MTQPWDYDILVKILVVGDSSVGKSCLLLRYADNTFSNTHMATIGVDFKLKTEVINNKKTKIQIWDTAGQERFRTITGSYYRGAHGIILVFDVTNEESFKNIPRWLDEIKSHASDTVSICLIGNKCDLKNQRAVTVAQAEELAKELDIPYLETSAKDAINVDKAFQTIINSVIQKQSYLQSNESNDKRTFRPPVLKPTHTEKQTGCCG